MLRAQETIQCHELLHPDFEVPEVSREGSGHENWMEMYNRLLAYKEEHGNARVPKRYDEDPKLGIWVLTQLRRCKDKDRIDLLKKIGFEWKLRDSSYWMNMYRRLVADKKEHGNTRRYKEDPKLETRVYELRSRCKDKDRIDLLNEIRFQGFTGRE
jgi:hypothetical protein